MEIIFALTITVLVFIPLRLAIMKFTVFSVPVTIDFSTDTLDKQERYEELCSLTDDNDSPVDMELYSERVELFHELVELGAIDPTED